MGRRKVGEEEEGSGGLTSRSVTTATSPPPCPCHPLTGNYSPVSEQQAGPHVHGVREDGQVPMCTW